MGNYLTLGVGNYVIAPLGNYLTLQGLRPGNYLIADTGARSGGMNKPRVKIPDVCRARGIRLATVSDFVEARGKAL